MPCYTKAARRRHIIEPLESRVLLAADWQNPIDPLDVDGSNDAISPLDALLVINELSAPSVSEPGSKAGSSQVPVSSTWLFAGWVANIST